MAQKSAAREMRTTDEEISLFKATFAGKDDTLKLIRSVLFGFDISADEKKFIKDLFTSDSLTKAFNKFFLPELEKDVPLGQQVDLWMTIQIAEKTEEVQKQIIQSRSFLIQQIRKGLSLLREPDAEKINLDVIAEMSVPQLIARNTYISHVEQMLMHIKILAGKVEETVEATKARLAKDSSQ